MANSVGDLIDKIKEYIELKTEQLKLLAIERLAKVLSGILSISIIFFISLFFLFFLSFAFANYLNGIFESTFIGYLILCGIYVLMTLILAFLIKRGIVQSWFEKIILKAAENEQDD